MGTSKRKNIRRHKKIPPKPVESGVPMTRKQKADTLKKAGVGWAIKYGLAVFEEVGLCSWGTLRADLLCLSFREKLTLIEVKSCKSDFLRDKKYTEYRNFAHKMYFLFHDKEEKWLHEYYDHFKSLNIGVLLLDSNTGYVYTKIKCGHQKMKRSVRRNLIVRMAFKAADATRFKNRRTRVYIT